MALVKHGMPGLQKTAARDFQGYNTWSGARQPMGLCDSRYHVGDGTDSAVLFGKAFNTPSGAQTLVY